jgi:hypothetical protein
VNIQHSNIYQWIQLNNQDLEFQKNKSTVGYSRIFPSEEKCKLNLQAFTILDIMWHRLVAGWRTWHPRRAKAQLGLWWEPETVQVTPSLFSEINYFQHGYIKSGLNSIKALTKVTKKNQTSLYLLVFVQFIKTNCTQSVSKLCCRATTGSAHWCQQMFYYFNSLTTTQHIEL